MARTRLRHFPRESLIARLSSGEASIVKVEAETAAAKIILGWTDGVDAPDLPAV
jgi:hypothetical protein